MARRAGRLGGCGLRAKGMLGPVGDPSHHVFCSHAASGQISAKSSRGRVLGGTLASSRQRSLKHHQLSRPGWPPTTSPMGLRFWPTRDD